MTITAYPRFEHIELEITTHCDMKCFSCDRFIDVGQTTPMTVEQIKHFVDESLILNWHWKRIHILGGEPTLHPQFIEVVEELLRYKNTFPEGILRVITNGSGKLSQYDEWLRSKRVQVNVESKSHGVPLPPWFSNMRIVPVDEQSDVGALPPCSIFGIGGCGIGLNKYGYFPCGAGAGIARILGLDIGIMKLEDLTYEACLKQTDILCRVCGHWNADGQFDIEGKTLGFPPVRLNKLRQTGEVCGPFWAKAIEEYKKGPPKMTLYGE